MVSLKLRTENPSLAFHIATYLDATDRQLLPNTTIYRFIELGVVREAALIHVALTTGFIERSQVEGYLPNEIWIKCIDIVNNSIENP